MALQVREVFPTLQGEGSEAGRPAVFVRLSGCNLWSGLDHLRSKGKGDCAAWCDTDFAHGQPVPPGELVLSIVELCEGWGRPSVVITGGEPVLQLVKPHGRELLRGLRDHGVFIAIETNGTQRIPDEIRAMIDHVTVSPKGLVGKAGDAGHIVQREGTDFKAVVPSPFSVETLRDLARDFDHRFVQPKDERGDTRVNQDHAIEIARMLGWRVSLQTHKLAGLP